MAATGSVAPLSLTFRCELPMLVLRLREAVSLPLAETPPLAFVFDLWLLAVPGRRLRRRASVLLVGEPSFWSAGFMLARMDRLEGALSLAPNESTPGLATATSAGILEQESLSTPGGLGWMVYGDASSMRTKDASRTVGGQVWGWRCLTFFPL